MSLLPTNVYSGYQGDPTQGPVGIFLQPDLGRVLYVSTISTSRLQLDGNAIDTTGSGGSASLLLNGTAIATSGQLSTSIANWSLYQAISTVTYATGGGSGGAVVMSNGIFSNVSTTTGKVNQLTVSTLNGQTVPQLGQTVLFRSNSLISTAQFNTNNPTLPVLSFANPLAGGVVQGVFNADFGGIVAGSNSSGLAPYYGAFISDTNVSPYTPSNAISGNSIQYFYPVGISNITNVNGPYNWNIQVPFAFSNSPSNLYLIWAEQNTPVPTLLYNTVSTNFTAVIGGGTATAV